MVESHWQSIFGLAKAGLCATDQGEEMMNKRNEVKEFLILTYQLDAPRSHHRHQWLVIFLLVLDR